MSTYCRVGIHRETGQIFMLRKDVKFCSIVQCEYIHACSPACGDCVLCLGTAKFGNRLLTGIPTGIPRERFTWYSLSFTEIQDWKILSAEVRGNYQTVLSMIYKYGKEVDD